MTGPSRSEALRRLASGACRWLAAVCLATCVFGVGQAVVRKLRASAQDTRYLVVSSRPPERDEAFRQLAAQTAVLMYTRADSGLAQKLAEWRAPGGPLAVYVETGGRTVSVSSSPAALAEAMDAASLSVDAQKMPPVFVGALVGAAVGALVRASAMSLGAALLAGVGACLAKALTACQACERPLFIELPVEAWGAAAYGLAAAGTFLGRMPWPLLGLGAGAALAVQAAATFATGSDCLPCGLVAGVNAALLVSVASSKAESGRAVTPLAWASGLAGLAAAAVCARWEPSHSPNELLRTEQRWTGRKASELGAIAPPPSGKRLVMLWSRGCNPCDDAIQWLSAKPDFEVDMYRVKRPGSPPGPDDARSVSVGPELSRTPAFFVVDSDGVIRAEYYGWSDNSDWTRAFVQSVRNELEKLDER